ncbi:putative protein kinase C delta type homolog [Uloborus diversus]|uniref:putative protein kinase C delta type homolog n=1 Tax=Uloborus diversus TaxID=327109 RepID=UPI0024093958|nr:putative protein kinase C delta type homolog [Uloborus diversus]
MSLQRNLWDGFFRIALVNIDLNHDGYSSNNIIYPGCVVTITKDNRHAAFRGSGHLVSIKYDWNCYFELPYNEDISLLLEILEKPNKFLVSCALTTYDLNELCPDNDCSYSKWVHLNSKSRLLIQIEYHSSDDLAIAFPSCTPNLEKVIHHHAFKKNHRKKSHESKLQQVVAAISQKPILYAIRKKILRASKRPMLDHEGFQSPERQRRTHDRDDLPSSSVKESRYGREDVLPKSPEKNMPFREYHLEDFTFLKVLGKGSFGKVLLATLKNTEMYFAIKALKKDVLLEDDDIESAMIEKKILIRGTKHPYMCKLYCSFQSESYLFFVMEYLNGGDLMFHINAGRFDLRRTIFYAAEIITALKFMHQQGIIYRDIKLDNVMLDRDGHIRLVDFGMCHCYIYKEECLPCNFCGTPMYIAPEILNGEAYNQAVDWWSFGVLLYEMLNGRSPFCGTDDDELFWSICNEEPTYPHYLTKESVDILKLLLNKKPQDRLGSPSCPAGDIENQPFFNSIDWKKIERKEVTPPVKPKIKTAYDCGNFDPSFTRMDATLTPVSPNTLGKIEQNLFLGFTYTNPNITGN